MEEIWAIILAAGESKRMGSPKMLLPFNGGTMLERVISNVRASAVNKILVVLGSDKDKVLTLVERTSVNHCLNENYTDGMLSSVKCGFRSLPQNFSAVLIFQGDQPLISPDTINNVIKARQTSGKEILIPIFEGKRGHPLLVGKKFRKEIETMESDQGLRALSARHPEEVFEVETDDPGILKDFDTYDEYLKEINQIS
jgi:molybdenum cofactor cytidylyltransferase